MGALPDQHHLSPISTDMICDTAPIETMKMKRSSATRSPFFLALTMTLAVLASPATVASGFNIDISIGDGDRELASDASDHRKGPPGHAPAHGYRAKHQYHYYPSADVYFDTGSRIYFYLSNKTWQASATIPLSLKAKLGDHVSLALDSDKPYTRHGEHKKKYGHEKGKKENKHGQHDD